MTDALTETINNVLEDAADVIVEIPRRRRHLGRTLLVLALVAVGLAAVAYYLKRQREEDVEPQDIVDLAPAEDSTVSARNA